MWDSEVVGRMRVHGPQMIQCDETRGLLFAVIRLWAIALARCDAFDACDVLTQLYSDEHVAPVICELARCTGMARRAAKRLVARIARYDNIAGSRTVLC